MGLFTGASRREQRLMMVVLLLVLAGVIGWVGLPLWDRCVELNRQVAVAERTIVKLRTLAAQAPHIEQAHASYAALMTTDTNEVAHRAFLEELEELARQENLQISLKPGRVERQGRVTRLGVEVEADATQEQLLAFLDRVLGGSGLIEVDRLRLVSTASKEHPLKGQVTLSRVAVHP